MVLNNGNVGLAIADVADKGVPAALFMALSRTVMRATTMSGRSPADALRRTNEILVIDNGAIVERGPTASLLDDPDSVYATLLRTGALT